MKTGPSTALAAWLRLVWRPRVLPSFPGARPWPAADCTARALPMTGQRWASSWSLEMVPPQGDWGAGRVDVDRARSVAGDAFLRNGHMALDCRKTASMVRLLKMDCNWRAWFDV